MFGNQLLEARSVSFGERLAASAAFDALFRDGMGLVEQTAAYLDGVGREESRSLPRTAALAYASESMRLTTRLMQIASWLLLQRAINEGEMTSADAAADKHRSRHAWQAGPNAHSDLQPTLPEALTDLIGKSFDLLNRVRRLDAAICEVATMPINDVQNAVGAQFALLQRAFPG